MKYWDLMDVDDFWDSVDSGYIRMQSHPEFSKLVIANYTEQATFENWFQESPATKHSRGLIFNNDNGDVIARPFPKFFNYGQTGAPEVPMDAPVIATDKMDGSLGIIYIAPDGSVRVATRGSFASDQALHATRVLNEQYPGWCKYFTASNHLGQHWTPLVEIIYPENRIVCDYGTMDDLVLLGGIQHRMGTYYAPNELYWDGPRADVLPYETFAQALAAPDREGKEGVVLYVPEISDWVKLKQSDYVELHRIVTGLSARRVYEALVSGQSVEEICAPLPDEFHEFVKDVASAIETRVRHYEEDRVEDFDRIRDELMRGGPVTNVRKAFAELAKQTTNPGMMFALLDNKSITGAVVKLFQPSADWVPGNHQEKLNEFRLMHRR